jgi:hypothetical protein
MNAADIKTELRELIENETDLHVLEAIKTLLKKSSLDSLFKEKLTSRALKSEEDIENKKEGWYITGLPEAGVDPIRGFGIGGSVFLFNNKDRSDPFFYYTPYRSRYSITLNAFQSGMVYGSFNLDIPFAFDSKWRLRMGVILCRRRRAAIDGAIIAMG